MGSFRTLAGLLDGEHMQKATIKLAPVADRGNLPAFRAIRNFGNRRHPRKGGDPRL